MPQLNLRDHTQSGTFTRRDFLRGSAASLACVSAFDALPLFRGAKLTDYSPVIEKIKQMFPIAMRLKDITAASIALVDDERIIWSEGFGYTTRSNTVKVTADTLFHAGSISKSFTTLGVLKAVDKGLLGLDDPVKKYLPWFRVNSRFGEAEAESITIRHLLSHHSGLGTWCPLGNPSDPQYQTRTFAEVVESTRGSWLKCRPGQRFEYSNQGIDLAGYALQVASGKPFVDLMRDEILIPLGMTNSTFNQREATQRASCAVGYLRKRPVPTVNGVVMPLVAAGGLFASANDLARFVIFHLRGGNGPREPLVPQRLLQEMYAPQFTAKQQPSGYGLGIYKAIQYGTERFSHGGLGYGISTHYRFLPEHKIGVVVLTNQDSAHNAPALSDRVIELLLAAKFGTVPQNKPTTNLEKSIGSLDKSGLRRFEGSYLLYEGILFQFKYERGNLFHLVGNEKLKLEPYSANEFICGSRRYKFLPGDNQKPQGVQITDAYYDPHTAENSVIYLPLNDTPTDSRGFTKPTWSNYIGKYTGTFIGAISEARISLRNGYLYLNGELKLTETSPELFTTADGDAILITNHGLSVGNKSYSKEQ